jgi:hypothetical protein
MKEEIKNKIEDFLNSLNTEIDVLYCVDVEEIEIESAYDSIYQMIEDSQGFDIDIIYYSNAIDYLSKNDPSLQESCDIASGLGYSTESLNSELLASLLASQNVREEFCELESEIESFFEDIQEEIEEFENEEE